MHGIAYAAKPLPLNTFMSVLERSSAGGYFLVTTHTEGSAHCGAGISFVKALAETCHVAATRGVCNAICSLWMNAKGSLLQ